METETVRDLISKIGNKIGENFMNQKQYVVLPVYKSSPSKMQFLPIIADYGGLTTDKQEKTFNIAQSNGAFDYDANYINWNTFIKNLKTTTVKLTEKVYVDKPIGMQKAVPMQRKKDLAQTF